jgi:TonB family protein
MGKIVKYCAACDESFAEKFGFCPNCGQAMTAFEMNPVVKEAQAVEETKTETVVNNSVAETPPTISFDSAPKIETVPVAETIAFSANQAKAFSNDIETEVFEEIEEPKITPAETKTFAAAAGTNGNGHYETTNYNFQNTTDTPVEDGYRITVIEEKNIGQRNNLLLGTMALMLMLVMGGWLYSLFSKDFGVTAIGDESLFAMVPIIEDTPVDLEEQEKPKNDKDAGGGGGGGKEEQEPASKGRLVSQSEKPITPPSVNIPQLKNPSLPVIMETQGNIKRPITEERPGLPGSDNLNPSNGTGRGGGIGGGNGTGIGGGNGTGEGNGNGSGSGNGNGNGNGNGTGDGNQGRTTPPPPPPTRPAGVTTDVKILSKPSAKYTDAARTNQFSGTVRLRVTFSASGQVTSVSPVGSLPYGLTEMAIAAAKSIRFEPAKKDGVPITKVKQIDYSFTLY